MTYELFFQIHIPKTGGTYFTDKILNQISPSLNNGGVRTKSFSKEERGKHLCWFEPLIKENTYIYTTLRDPVKRMINQFCHQATLSIERGLTTYTWQDINKEMFYLWIDESNGMYKNVQAKSLVYSNADTNQYKKAKHLGWEFGSIPKLDHFMFSDHFINYSINKDTLFEHVKRINLITKSEDFDSANNQKKIVNRIFKDLSIIDNKEYMFSKTYANPMVEDIILKLSKKEVDDLYNYLDLDSELYFSDIYTKY